MPIVVQSSVPRSRFNESQRALLTPSASPSVGPPDRPPTKRPRLRSTPSSSISATPSTSNESTTSADVNSARKASTLRVLNTWAQLAERYNKPLDEDDIIDLHRYVIIKDRGAVEGASKEYHIGHFTLDSDQDFPDADQDQEDSEQDEDDNELNALPPSETATDDDVPISKKELLRGVPPLSATTDAEDLKEFLEAEKKRRELAGDEEDEEGMSPEQLSVLRKELEERLQKKEAAIASTAQARDVASTEPTLEREADATPTRSSARVPPSDDESEDELALWTHDESTAVYPVAQQDVHEVEREVIELTDSDSDEEFEAILTHPPRFSRVSPPPISIRREVQQPLRSPPDSNCGRAKSRTHTHSKIKSAEVPNSEDRPCSPVRVVPRKTEVTLTHKRKPSVSKATSMMTSDDRKSSQDVVSHIPPTSKGKGKEVLAPVEEGNRERTPKSLGAVARGRKRKRIVSSTIGGNPSVQSPVEPERTLRNHGKSTPQRPITPPQPNGHKQTVDKDVSTPVRIGPNTARPSRSLSSAPKSQAPTSTDPACGPHQPESVQLTPHDHSPNRSLLSDLPDSVPITYPYSQRHPSHPPSIFPSPNQITPGLPLPAHPPPMDPVQTQQAHYLLAQAMHQLSYFLSATMPSYAAYAPNPCQPWNHTSPPPRAAYGTPIHHPPHFHDTHHYPTPSSSMSRSGLPPSSPVRSSVSPPVEERHARSRGRSKSRGRRVSFKLDSVEVVDREDDTQPEHQHNGQKNRRPALGVKKERGKGRATDEFGDSLPLKEDRGSPPREVARGRTPGPPNRKKINVPRDTSLSRR